MPIRILVVGLPQMMKEVVCSLLAREPDLHLVSGTENGEGVSRLIRETETDVLVRVSPESGLREAAVQLLQEHPRLRIVALTPSGRRAFRVELRPHVARIDEVSPQGLVEAIRHAADPTWLPAGVSEAH